MIKEDEVVMKAFYTMVNEKTKYGKGDAVWYINPDGEDIEANVISVDKKTGDVLIYINKDKSELRVNPSEIERDV